MDAGARLGASEGDDVADLLQRQSQAASLRDEVQDAQHVGRVGPIPGWRASGLRDNAAGFVETQRLATYTAPARDLSDGQGAFVHGPRIDLAA